MPNKKINLTVGIGGLRYWSSGRRRLFKALSRSYRYRCPVDGMEYAVPPCTLTAFGRWSANVGAISWISSDISVAQSKLHHLKSYK